MQCAEDAWKPGIAFQEYWEWIPWNGTKKISWKAGQSPFFYSTAGRRSTRNRSIILERGGSSCMVLNVCPSVHAHVRSLQTSNHLSQIWRDYLGPHKLGLISEYLLPVCV